MTVWNNKTICFHKRSLVIIIIPIMKCRFDLYFVLKCKSMNCWRSFYPLIVPFIIYLTGCVFFWRWYLFYMYGLHLMYCKNRLLWKYVFKFPVMSWHSLLLNMVCVYMSWVLWWHFRYLFDAQRCSPLFPCGLTHFKIA